MKNMSEKQVRIQLNNQIKYLFKKYKIPKESQNINDFAELLLCKYYEGDSWIHPREHIQEYLEFYIKKYQFINFKKEFNKFIGEKE